MIIVQVTNMHCKLAVKSPPGEDLLYNQCLNRIYKKLSIFNKSAPFGERFHSFKQNGDRMWDGYTHFFNKNKKTFLTGLLPFVMEVITACDLPYTIDNKCVKPQVEREAVYLIGSRELRDYQKESIDIHMKVPRGIYSLSTNAGKGLRPDEVVLTPTGWTQIKHLNIGDSIIAGDGSITTILGIFDRGIQPTFKVSFSDRTSIVCDGDHLWAVQAEKNQKINKWDVFSTNEIIERAKKVSHRSSRLLIPICGAVQFTKKQLKLDPYVLGVLLGDGCLRGQTPVITSNDYEIHKDISKNYPTSYRKTKERCPAFSILGIHNIIQELGLIGTNSNTKFIPTDYLLSDVNDRLSLLQGLMDTDGYISKTGHDVSFCSVSKDLAEGVAFLVRSLSGRATITTKIPTYIYNNEKIQGQLAYTVYIKLTDFIPFRLARKVERVKIYKKRNNKCIIGIESIGSQRTICLAVNHPSKLFVTKDFIVTHNTSIAVGIAESTPVKTLFLVDRRELFLQACEAFSDYSSRNLGSISSGDFNPSDVTIGMVKTIASRLNKPETRESTLEYLESVDMFFADECVSPDTEILTSNGWMLIKDVTKQNKVAQWDSTETIEFVHPTKLIKKEFKGELVHLTSQRHIDILATPTHEQPYKQKSQRTNNFHIKKVELQDLQLNSWNSLPIAGNNIGTAKLTPFLRFVIMTQADGHLCPLNKTTNYRRVQFQFTKQRKIKRFFEIMSQVNFEWNEVKCTRPDVRRFIVHAPKNINKLFSDFINLEDVNTEFTTAFINELVQWDGSKKASFNKTGLYYSTTSCENADTVQAICALGGWACGRSVQVDKRKETYNDVHRFWFYKRMYRDGQRIKKNKVPYNGNVYCVRVPSGNIVIRRNKKVMITGNCHKATSTTWKKVLMNMPNAYYRYGLSGTPIIPDDIRNINLIGIMGPLIQKVSNMELVEKNVSARPILQMVSYESLRAPSVLDYNTLYEEHIVDNERRNELAVKIAVQEYETTGSVLLIVESLKHGQNLQKIFTEYGHTVPFACGELISLSERDDIYREFKAKRIPIVIASMIYKEGVDIDAIDSLIYLVGEKSPVTVLQVLGRGLRKREDKDVLRFFDFNDNHHRIFTKHTKQRLQIYTKEGFKVHTLKERDIDETFRVD